MVINTPREFSFDLCLGFLQRSPQELLHELREGQVFKAVRLHNEAMVFSVGQHADGLAVDFHTQASAGARKGVAAYVREWFDLDTDLKPFYTMAAKDKLLAPLVTRYYGYRIVGQPDLFESLVWAVLGQQINLAFAYTLKRRFVQQFGERLATGDREYFLFPSPDSVALIAPEELLKLQFSRQKSSYTIAIAEAFAAGVLTKEKLAGLPLQEARDELMRIKGVGNWTANYALMKTFRYTDAFPLEDAGLHNAIRILKQLGRKPTLAEVTRIFKKYRGWEAYATLYLWRSLV